MMLTRLKIECANNNVPFNITITDVKQVYSTSCALSSIAMVRGKNSITRPVLAMCDKTLGYVEGNIMITSYIADQVRDNLSIAAIGKLLAKCKVLAEQ
jgi:hypothetical protein